MKNENQPPKKNLIITKREGYLIINREFSIVVSAVSIKKSIKVKNFNFNVNIRIRRCKHII